MGNPKAFLTIPRQEAGYRPVHDRINDYGEVEQTLNTSERKLQASRCMDCGVPFCHWACPLGNRPPEFQDALERSLRNPEPDERFPGVHGTCLPRPVREKLCAETDHRRARHHPRGRMRRGGSRLPRRIRAAASHRAEREARGGRRFRAFGTVRRQPVEQKRI